MITTEEINKMIEDIYNKAANNDDRIIWIRPSDYGFQHSCEATNECIKALEDLQICKSIAIDGKDLLRIEI